MRERTMLKIGEFARVAQVSIATLRHYDQCGLLKPNELDPDTGYRYYSLDQLARLNRILALKELGFSLEQVAHLLEKDLSLEQLRGMFTLKQAQTQQMTHAPCRPDSPDRTGGKNASIRCNFETGESLARRLHTRPHPHHH